MPVLLSSYIARRLLLTIAVVYVIIFTLVFLIDFVDLVQDAGSGARATVLDVTWLGLMRAPAVAEEILPFTVLFAAIAAFVSLSRKLELVVARATGVSIWQMLAPALLAAGFFGIAVTAVHNPLSTWLTERAVDFRAQFSSSSGRGSDLRWIRQQTGDNQSILRAEDSADRGATLTGVTAFVFSPEGAFQERIDAPRAQLRDGAWDMQSARVARQGFPPESRDVYSLPTNLTADQVTETIAKPQSISFWQLPKVIAQWERSGIRTERFRLHYQKLMARPATYATMVLIAATVSLGFARFGGLSRAVFGGVLAGFMLYVGTEIAGDLGAAGFISPLLAAWAPLLVGVLLSVTVLLHQEDG